MPLSRSRKNSNELVKEFVDERSLTTNYFCLTGPVSFDMSVIKAIVVDIDGTLTDMQRHISTDAIQAIREMPVPVVLASGNVICFMRAASKLIGASEAMIGETGGVIQVGYDSSPVVLADIEECRQSRGHAQETFPGHGAARRPLPHVRARFQA